MNQNSRHNRYLHPIYFSIEMCLRWNLGPLHFLKYLIEDVYNRDKKLYIRKTTRTDQVVTKDLTKSAVISTFQKKIWRKVQSTSLILDLKQPTQISKIIFQLPRLSVHTSVRTSVRPYVTCNMWRPSFIALIASKALQLYPLPPPRRG